MSYVVRRKIRPYKFTEKEVKCVYRELEIIAKEHGMSWVDLYKYLCISKATASLLSKHVRLTTRTAYLIIQGLETPELNHDQLHAFLVRKVRLSFPLAGKDCMPLSDKVVKVNKFKVYLYDALCREGVLISNIEKAIECSTGKVHTQMFSSGALTSLVLQGIISVVTDSELRMKCLHMQRYLNNYKVDSYY